MGRSSQTLCLLALTFSLAGCAPVIGDECSSSLDCSVDGDRICDLAQPGGYCTVQGCDFGTCPDEAVCVQWQGSVPRTAQNWCMLACESDGDCRGGDGYACVRSDDPRLLDDEGLPLAEVYEMGNLDARFCAAVN